jgi:Ca2+-binding RTX toxin-like protein
MLRRRVGLFVAVVLAMVLACTGVVLADVLSGTESSDNLVGKDGADALYGRKGDDNLKGGQATTTSRTLPEGGGAKTS